MIELNKERNVYVPLHPFTRCALQSAQVAIERTVLFGVVIRALSVGHTARATLKSSSYDCHAISFLIYEYLEETGLFDSHPSQFFSALGDGRC